MPQFIEEVIRSEYPGCVYVVDSLYGGIQVIEMFAAKGLSGVAKCRSDPSFFSKIPPQITGRC